MMPRVLVTGLGAISAFGRGVEPLWQGCLQGAAKVAPIPARWAEYYQPISKIWSPLPEFDYTALGFTRSELLTISPLTLLALTASEEALDQAQIRDLIPRKSNQPQGAEITRKDHPRGGIFIGTGLSVAKAPFDNYRAHLLSGLRQHFTERAHDNPDDTLIREHVEALRAHPRVNPLVIVQSMPNGISAALGIRYRFRGPNDTACYACASGTVAIGRAYAALRNGELDYAIAGGVEHLSDRAGGVFMGFDRLQTLAKPFGEIGEENRPFDKNRSGFLFAEGGAGLMFLETESFARTRAAKPIAEIAGYGLTSDATSLVALSESDNAIEAMFDQALASAQTDRSEIGYINAHGTSTELNDSVEATMVARYFGRRPKINSTKSILGHTIGASGALEAIVCVQSLAHQTVHVSRNLREPVADLNFCTETSALSFEYALSQSFGFGGHNAALVFRRYDAPNGPP
jgi:3-oxoacyl-[acyl-carrier-protein] synthase II